MDYFKITHFIFKNFNLILIFKKKKFRSHILFFLLKFVKLRLLLKYHWKLGITLIISQISFFIFRKRLTSHRAVCWTEPGTTLLSKNWRRYQESEYKQPQKHLDHKGTFGFPLKTQPACPGYSTSKQTQPNHLHCPSPQSLGFVCGSWRQTWNKKQKLMFLKRRRWWPAY